MLRRTGAGLIGSGPAIGINSGGQSSVSRRVARLIPGRWTIGTAPTGMETTAIFPACTHRNQIAGPDRRVAS